jgi:CRISPR/Cas system-associated exonuclease Cas4 (RecB family)
MNKSEILQKFTDYEQGHTVFLDKNHTYTIDSALYAGVSSIVEERAKPFLVPWASKEAVKLLGWDKTLTKKVEEAFEAIKKLTPEQYLELLNKAKGRYVEIGDVAKKSGTATHDWIEDYIKTGVAGEIPNGKDDISIAISNAINAFLEWEHKHKPEWIVSEKIIFSLKHQFAGTLDALAFIDGQLCIVDFKTSNQISDSYALQIAGYMICLEEAGIKVDRRLILRIPKDGTKAEDCVVATDEVFDKETFLHFREGRRWKTYIESNFTYRENGYDVVRLDKNKKALQV